MALGILLIVTLIFAIRGYSMGFVDWLIKTVGLLMGFMVAYSFREDVAFLLQPHLPAFIPDLLQKVLASILLFIGTVLVVNVCAHSVKKSIAKQLPEKDPKKRPLGNKLLGAGCNAAIGAVLAILILWCFGTVKSLILPANNGQAADPLLTQTTQFVNGLIVRFGKDALAQAGVKIALDENGKPKIESFDRPDMLANMTNLQQSLHSVTDQAPPSSANVNTPTIGRIQGSSMQSSTLQNLLNSDLQKKIRKVPYGANGDTISMDMATQQQIFQQLSTQPSTQPSMQDRAQMTQQLEKNPQLIQLMQDPELAKLIQSGDASALLKNEKFQALSHADGGANMQFLVNFLMMMTNKPQAAQQNSGQ